MATNSNAFELRRARSRDESGSPTAHFGHPVVLLTTTISALLVVGIVMILSASSVQSFASYGSSFVFFKKQLVSVALGLAAFFVAYRIDYRRLKGFGYLLLPAVALLLFLVLLPGVGVTVGGSQRWIRLGFTDFQPSELAKLALILFAADVFARKEESTFLEFSHTAIPMLPAIGILAGLIMMQPDLGTTVLLAFIAIGMLFVAGAPLRHIIPIGFSGAGLAIMAGLAAPYRRERILAFMDPWKDPLESGYHAIQSMIALGSGGFFVSASVQAVRSGPTSPTRTPTSSTPSLGRSSDSSGPSGCWACFSSSPSWASGPRSEPPTASAC